MISLVTVDVDVVWELELEFGGFFRWREDGGCSNELMNE